MFHNLKKIHSFGTEEQRADYLMLARSEMTRGIQAQSPRLLASCARLHNLLDQVDELGESFINVPVRSLD